MTLFPLKTVYRRPVVHLHTVAFVPKYSCIWSFFPLFCFHLLHEKLQRSSVYKAHQIVCLAQVIIFPVWVKGVLFVWLEWLSWIKVKQIFYFFIFFGGGRGKQTVWYPLEWSSGLEKKRDHFHLKTSSVAFSQAFTQPFHLVNCHSH